MRCKSCHAEVEAGDKFCGDCGAELIDISQPEKVVDEPEHTHDGTRLDATAAKGNSGYMGSTDAQPAAPMGMPPSGKTYPARLILLIFGMTLVSTLLLLPFLQLLAIPCVIGVVGTCTGQYIRKKTVRLSGRIFHRFSVFFAAAFLGFCSSILIYMALGEIQFSLGVMLLAAGVVTSIGVSVLSVYISTRGVQQKDN